MPNTFDQLFIFDLANNHQGDVEHGTAVIREVGAVARRHGVRAALKFQFRHLDSFIHPDHRASSDSKHIPRFLSTALTDDEFAVLFDEVHAAGMLTMCTPFDEQSVDLARQMDFDFLKIASCSAQDWPLLDAVARCGKPVVASTAGLSLEKIDRLASFFVSRGTEFALMHCVALYPTPPARLSLNRIDALSQRFPDVPIGFSTHEDPDYLTAVAIAYAKGARLFERHVGMASERHALNAYSSTPAQIDRWLEAYQDAVVACGSANRAPAPEEETASLRSLMRGAYVKTPIAAGSVIRREDVFFAMPLSAEQLDSGQFREGLVADIGYAANAPLSVRLAQHSLTDEQLVEQVVLQVQGMLNSARIFIEDDSVLELSHHYGLARFREFGAVIITCVNRTYCKKLIVQLPRQKHPYHYHRTKEETFHLLYGDLEVEKEGEPISLRPGQTLLVQPREWHKFHTLHGAIFEEISTTHFNNDSYYEDELIARLPREDRKTVVSAFATRPGQRR